MDRKIDNIVRHAEVSEKAIEACEESGYRTLTVGGGVAAMDADTTVVGHADEQRQPALESWAHRHHYRVTAFGYGSLALDLATAVVEVDPVGLKGVAEISPRGERSALTAADTEAADSIGRTLRDAFQMEFYHDYKTLPASLKGRRIALPKRREEFF